MKNSYKFALGLLVAILAIGFSAFKNTKAPEKTHSFDTTYYVTGTTTISGPGGGPGFTLGADPGGCSGTAQPCQIKAVGTLTLTSPVLQSVVNDPSKVTVVTRKP